MKFFVRPFLAGLCAATIFLSGWFFGASRLPNLFEEIDDLLNPVSTPLPHDPSQPQPKTEDAADVVAIECLAEVNAARAKRHLPAFVYNEGLSVGAAKVASYRAKNLIQGHTKNDFAFLPNGAYADGAGCAAWPDYLGWGACFTYENYRYAGAAWARGVDGKRYMSMFVAQRLSGVHLNPEKPEMVICPWCGHLKWSRSWCPHCHKWSVLGD